MSGRHVKANTRALRRAFGPDVLAALRERDDALKALMLKVDALAAEVTALKRQIALGGMGADGFLAAS